MSNEAKQRLRQSNIDSISDGVCPSICGDIWSQRGATLFGIVQNNININWEMEEHLLDLVPFSGLSHTAENIRVFTHKACAEMGIGEYTVESGAITLDTVADYVHKAVTDNASNMKAGWRDFHAATCDCHTVQLSVGLFFIGTR